MKIKTLLIVSAIGIALATPESLQAQAKPTPVRPDVGDVKDDAKEGVSRSRRWRFELRSPDSRRELRCGSFQFESALLPGSDIRGSNVRFGSAVGSAKNHGTKPLAR